MSLRRPGKKPSRLEKRWVVNCDINTANSSVYFERETEDNCRQRSIDMKWYKARLKRNSVVERRHPVSVTNVRQYITDLRF